MLRACLAATLLVGASTIPLAAQAQPADREAAIAAAERAVAEARQAAEESRSATDRLEQAVARAEQALGNLRRDLGLSSAPGQQPGAAPPATAVASSQPATTDSNVPAEENLPVDSLAAREQRQATTAALASSVANGPNGAGLKSSPIPDLQLVAAAGDAEASLAWTIDLSGNPRRPDRLEADQLTITATGRLNDGESRLLDLDGFSNGTRIEATYIHYWGRTNLTGRMPAQVAVAEANCRSLLRPEQPETCMATRYDTGVSEFVARFNPTGLEPMLELVMPGPVWFVGGEFEGTQSRFKYLDRTSFSILSQDRFGYGATVFGGALLGARGMTALAASYTYRRQYEEQDPVTLIQPIAGTNLSRELTGADGPPERGSQSILAVQLRHAFRTPVGRNVQLAIAPELSFDLGSDAWTIDFPFYFATDSEGKLRGGVRGIYVNQPDPLGGRTDSFTLGLFVGVPFSVFRE